MTLNILLKQDDPKLVSSSRIRRFAPSNLEARSLKQGEQKYKPAFESNYFDSKNKQWEGKVPNSFEKEGSCNKPKERNQCESEINAFEPGESNRFCSTRNTSTTGIHISYNYKATGKNRKEAIAGKETGVLKFIR